VNTQTNMSCNVSENVELGRLPPTEKEAAEDHHQEDDCEEENDKEGKEEEMSLLGVEDSQACPPVQIVIAGRRSSGPALIIPNPSHQLHVLTPNPSPCTDPDIQLAKTEPDKVWAVTMPTRHLSSIQSVCGPKPAKITTICMAMLSIWAMVVLIVHLEKKVSAVTSTLSSTEEKLRTMEDSASSYRLKTHQRLQKIQQKLSVILQTVDSGTKPSNVQQRKTKQLNSDQTEVSPTSSLPPDVSKHNSTEGNTDFFSNDWSLW